MTVGIGGGVESSPGPVLGPGSISGSGSITLPTAAFADVPTDLTVRLVDDTNSLPLYPRDDTELNSLDLGFPDVREDVEDFADSDGQVDTTSSFGGRVVAMELVLFDTPLASADAIKSWMHPSRRAYLHLTEKGWGTRERRIRVRAAQATVTRIPGVPNVATMQLQWKAPDGVMEEVVQYVNILPAINPAGVVGMAFPATLPMSFTAMMNRTSQVIGMSGSVAVDWVARLYGPCTGPRLTLDETGETLSFPNLVLAAGEYVEVDTRNRTALANGIADSSRLQYLDFTASTWWRLRPGNNTVRFQPLAASAGAQASVYWRRAWL